MSRSRKTLLYIDVLLSIHGQIAQHAGKLTSLGRSTIEIDNSAAQRAARSIAIGRRNDRSAGADSGGKPWASMYSLIGTAKLNAVDSKASFCHVLRVPPTIPSAAVNSDSFGIAPCSSRRMNQRPTSRVHRTTILVPVGHT